MKKKTIVRKTFQQGDCFGNKLDALPQGNRKRIAKGRCVIAHGESGHSHVIEDDEAELIQIGDKMLLSITKPLPIRHEEHHEITLSPGIWEIGGVQEYDYLSKMVRRVQD